MTLPQRTHLALLIVAAWFLIGTLPQLANYPVLDWPQMGIAAPAYKLASEGVYGNDLFTGFFGTELHNYEYMPAYPLLVAASFKIFGLGVWQARVVSVVCGLLVVLLTYQLTRQLFDRVTGVVAAAFLVAVRLSPTSEAAGITLMDFARVIRYDILVPVFVLVACRLFLLALPPTSVERQVRYQRWAYAGTGFFVGLATLAHVYGAFILPVFVAVLVWRDGWRAFLRPATRLLVVGWLVALVPWALYIAQDVAGYAGQMSRHQSRFALFDLGFYWNNLVREYGRYGAWTGGFPEGLWLPRLGFWIMVVGAIGGWVRLWKTRPFMHEVNARFVLLALPLLVLQYALLIDLKRHVYVLLLLPFIAIQVAYFAMWAWRRVEKTDVRWARTALTGLALVAVVEGGWGVARSLRVAGETTPYRQITGALAEAIPPQATVLISQPYWLGLVQYETRSINLPMILEPYVSMESTLASINPDFVVLERYFIDPTIRDSRQSTSPEALEVWRRIKEYLDSNCPTIVLTVGDPSYGIVDVYACGASAG